MDDRLLAAQLIERGLISPQALAQVQAQLQPGQPLAQALVARRLVPPQALASLVGPFAAPGSAASRPASRRFPSTQPGSARFPGTPASATGQTPTSRSGTGRHLPQEGETIDGRYLVTGRLGKGGMGVVFAAREVGTERPVAIKMLLPGKTSATHVKRFQREAQVAARLEHAGVIPVHASGEHQGCPYYVMEYVEGRDLGQIFSEPEPPPYEEVARLVEDVSRTLAVCHEAGILHRDLKPPNVMVRASDARPLVADFGLAREGTSERLTRTGQFLGTPGYMALEQLQDSKSSDHRADIYSLGAILFHGLAGEPPFTGSSLEQLFQAFTEDPPQPSDRRAGVPKALDSICLKAMARHPEDRYQTAGELADDLARWRDGEAVFASRGSALLTFGKRLRRRDRRAVIPVVALGGALLVALVSGLVYAGWILPGQRARESLLAYREFDRQRLEPYALGLGAGEAPSDEGLSAWSARLSAASEDLDASSQVAALSARDRVEAHRRLLRHLAGDEVDVPVREQSDRGTTDLLVDAIVWLDRERPQRALARVTLAAERGELAGALGLLRVALWEAILSDERADEAAQEFFVYLQRLETEGREAELAKAREQARQAVRKRYTSIVRAAPGQRRDETRDALARLLERAADPALGLTPAALEGLLAQPKVAILEETAADWERALEAGEAAGTEHARLDPVRHLGLVTRSAPAVAPGPRLRAALDACVQRAVAAYDAAENERQHELALQAVGLEATIFYEVDPSHVMGEDYGRLVRYVVSVDSYGNHVDTDAILAQLRTDTTRKVWETFLVQRFDPADLKETLNARPDSQALNYCLLMLVRRSATTRDGLDADYDLNELTDRLEQALATGTPDLRFNYLANAQVTVARVLLERLRAERDPTLGPRVERQLVEARRLCSDSLVFCRLFELEAQLRGALEGTPAEVQAWERAVQAFADAEREHRDDPVATDWDEARAELFYTRAIRLGQLEQPRGLAERVIREAVKQTHDHWTAERSLPVRARFAGYHLLARRVDEAEAVLAPRLGDGMADRGFAVLAVQTALLLGQKETCQQRLDQALLAHPGDSTLLNLQARLRR